MAPWTSPLLFLKVKQGSGNDPTALTGDQAELRNTLTPAEEMHLPPAEGSS